jgi:hypothetical protein
MGYGMALLLTMFRSVLTQLLAGLYPKLSRGVHYVRQKFEFRVNHYSHKKMPIGMGLKSES